MTGMESKYILRPVRNRHLNRLFLFGLIRRAVITLMLSSHALLSETITVSPSLAFSSIGKAIEMAEPGTTIVIEAGVYQESDIKIEKPLHLIGKGDVLIDGGGLGIFHILSDDVEISGLRFTNVKTSYTQEHAAIHAYKSNHLSIHDNVMEDVFFGILLEKSKYGVIENNTITSHAQVEYNSGNGIHLWHCSHMKVTNNQISGMRDGIYFEFVSHSQVLKNRSHNNIRYGLHFMFSNDDEYHDNVFRENGAGVAVMFSKHIVMMRNQFVRNWGAASYGLLLKEINDADISHNLFEKNTIAIKTEGSNRVNYHSNTFSRNGWAVKITGACYNNTFTRNDYLSNAFDISYKGPMNDNVFLNNYWSEYTGYDLDKDGYGDIPYRPVKLFSYVVNRTPETIVLLRSLFVDIINFSEKVSPVFTPDHLIDAQPLMQKNK